MFEPEHLPNKTELIMVFIIVGIALIATGIIFPLLISTDKIPLVGIIGLFLMIMFLIVMGLQFLFNLFYKKWQRKNERKSNKHSGRTRSKR